MDKSRFFSPLQALKRPDDIVALLVLCASLFVMLAYSLHTNAFPKFWAVFSLMSASVSGGGLIVKYTDKVHGKRFWLDWITSTVFLVSVVAAAFVDPAWLPFAWLLPMQFVIGWESRVYRDRKRPLSHELRSIALFALGLNSTYWAISGHWSLWLPAGIFIVACCVMIYGICFIAIVEMRDWLRQRRDSRERERAWKRDKLVIDALLPIVRELTSEWYYKDLCDSHKKRPLTKECLLEMIDGGLRGLKTNLDDTCRREKQANAHAESLQLEAAEEATRMGYVCRIKLAKLVFEILARFRQTPAPVDEGTLAQWRRDIGFELVASHLLDLPPHDFACYLTNWPVSGAYVKALLRHDQFLVTGYPSLSEDWRRALSAILIDNTLTQDAAPSAPAPAQQN